MLLSVFISAGLQLMNIAPLFEVLGLKDFCESNAELAVNRIIEFYSNLTYYKIKSRLKFIKTFVDGVTHVYSTHDANVMFGCEDYDSLPEVDKNESYSVILGHKASLPKYLESSPLELYKKVLH